MNWDMEGVRDKIARARENLNAFTDELARYVESDPYSVVPDWMSALVRRSCSMSYSV